MIPPYQLCCSGVSIVDFEQVIAGWKWPSQENAPKLTFKVFRVNVFFYVTYFQYHFYALSKRQKSFGFLNKGNVLYKRSSKHRDNRVLIYIHNFSILYCIFMETQNRWVKCLKNGPSKICGGQPSCLPKLFLYRCSECK